MPIVKEDLAPNEKAILTNGAKVRFCFLLLHPIIVLISQQTVFVVEIDVFIAVADYIVADICIPVILIKVLVFGIILDAAVII
jgi:hypothetical protein